MRLNGQEDEFPSRLRLSGCARFWKGHSEWTTSFTEEPITASEDFSVFVSQGIPGFYLHLGGADPQKFAEVLATGTHLPSNHSPLFAPDVDRALHTAISAEVAMLLNLLEPDSKP